MRRATRSRFVILFDNNAGHLSSSEVNQKMVLLILANGAEIKQTVSSKTTMTFTPVKKE